MQEVIETTSVTPVEDSQPAQSVSALPEDPFGDVAYNDARTLDLLFKAPRLPDPFATPTNEQIAEMFDFIVEEPLDEPTVAATKADESVSGTACVEWDHKARVIRARYSCGNVAQYKYDAEGNLYAFVYARLAWTTADGYTWRAQDGAYEYTIEARISVETDGTLRIEKEDFTRTLKLNGFRLDEYKNGSRLESKPIREETSPLDLLATSKPITGGWQKTPEEFVEPGDSQVADGTENVRRDSIWVQVHTHETVKSLSDGPSVERLRVLHTYARVEPSTKERLRMQAKETLANSSINLIEYFKGRDDGWLPIFLDILAESKLQQRKIDEAEQLHARSLRIRRRKLGPLHESTGINLFAMAKIYHELNRYEEAVDAYQDAINVFERGLRKHRFLHESSAISAKELVFHLKRLLDAVDALGRLYAEHDKIALCYQSSKIAIDGWTTVDGAHKEILAQTMHSIRTRLAEATEARPSQTVMQPSAQSSLADTLYARGVI